MRIVESRATALTVRHPRPALETVAVAPAASRDAPPPPQISARPARAATPDAGFVMQLIATAAPAEADPSPPRAVGVTYGRADRAMTPPRSGDRVARSI